MKGDELVEVGKKSRYFTLFGGVYFHVRYHVKPDRIDSCFCRHFHGSIVKPSRKKGLFAISSG